MPVQFTSMGFMLALVAGVAAFHVAICLYAIANPAIVAAEVARPSRSFLAWAYLSALRVGRNDSEMDLVQSGLPSDAVVANCRRRAVMALGFSLLSIGSIAIASLVGLFAGHL